MKPWYWPEGGQPYRTEPFTWIVKGKIAASWWPDKNLFKKYELEGISVIINCSEFNNRKDVPEGFTYYHFNVPDYGLPTDNQIDRFLKICEKHMRERRSIVVHCVAGCGRTGQFIVAWAAYNGYIPKGTDPVKWIKKIRPCCLETQEQMKHARYLASKWGKYR
ncbi:MAG: protein-tyrosine phosphatase family protein [Promethearchaeota archaeon]